MRQQATTTFADVKQKMSDTLHAIKSIKQPGQMSRLKDAAVQQLPYHPQYLAKGTVYDAELSSPISFGRVVPAVAAPAGTAPAPDSILIARLATTLDSSKTPRGTPFEAVLTQTVFSADHQVILPEGTTLTGEVTFAKPAQRFHRNGQLRFLFERVQVPNQPSAPLLGALHSVDASDDDHVAVDDEGGATLDEFQDAVHRAGAVAPGPARVDRTGRPAATPTRRRRHDQERRHRCRQPRVGGFIGMGFVGAAASARSRVRSVSRWASTAPPARSTPTCSARDAR